VVLKYIFAGALARAQPRTFLLLAHAYKWTFTVTQIKLITHGSLTKAMLLPDQKHEGKFHYTKNAIQVMNSETCFYIQL
jgi:hypothetical protein